MTQDLSDQIPNPAPIATEDPVIDIHALEGIYLLYWKFEECAETFDTDPQLSKHERHMLLSLDSPRRMGDLARGMLALPSTLTSIADALEAKGLIERQRDPSDRRAWLLHLSPQGAVTRDALARHAGELFRDVTGLTAKDIAQFAEISLKIRNRILETGMPKGPQT